jgi:hypothetical protein
MYQLFIKLALMYWLNSWLQFCGPESPSEVYNSEWKKIVLKVPKCEILISLILMIFFIMKSL